MKFSYQAFMSMIKLMSKTLEIVVVHLVVVLAVFVLGGCQRGGCDDVYARSTSPDGRFEIVVCRRSEGLAMPGQGGDAPGLIRLRDVSTGRVLREAPIEMVQQFPGVKWTEGYVRIMLIADWPVPAADAGSF